MNQNPISDVVNPIYQHPGPPRTLLPTISSDHTETEYLNYFKNGAAGPEYLNEILSPAVLPLTSNGTVHSIEKYLPQQSIDNPDYQQDFTPTFKTHTNGHIPAAENAEYLGPDWLSGMWQEIRDYLWKALSSVSWLDCWVVPPYSVLSYGVSWQFEQHCWHAFKLNQSHSKDFFFFTPPPNYQWERQKLFRMSQLTLRDQIDSTFVTYLLTGRETLFWKCEK